MNVLVLVSLLLLVTSATTGCGTARMEIDRGERFDVYEEGRYTGYYQSGVFFPAHVPQTTTPVYKAPHQTIIVPPPPTPPTQTVPTPKAKATFSTVCDRCGKKYKIELKQEGNGVTKATVSCPFCFPKQTPSIELKHSGLGKGFWGTPSQKALTQPFAQSKEPADVPRDHERFDFAFNGTDEIHYQKDVSTIHHHYDENSVYGEIHDHTQEVENRVTYDKIPAQNFVLSPVGRYDGGGSYGGYTYGGSGYSRSRSVGPGYSSARGSTRYIPRR